MGLGQGKNNGGQIVLNAFPGKADFLFTINSPLRMQCTQRMGAVLFEK